MINIAKRIKELRIKKDLTQAQVAESVGLARASYISVEQGKRDLSLQEVEKLAHMLGVSLGELVYSEGVGYEKYEQMLFVFLRSVSSKKKLTKTKLANNLPLIFLEKRFDLLQKRTERSAAMTNRVLFSAAHLRTGFVFGLVIEHRVVAETADSLALP